MFICLYVSCDELLSVSERYDSDIISSYGGWIQNIGSFLHGILDRQPYCRAHRLQEKLYITTVQHKEGLLYGTHHEEGIVPEGKHFTIAL